MIKTYNVSFWAMNGDLLGVVQVEAATESKAKIKASTLYTCSWTSQTAERA